MVDYRGASRKERDDEGRLKLIAGASGEIAYDGKSIDIVGIHTVQGDVGPATGNVGGTPFVRKTRSFPCG